MDCNEEYEYKFQHCVFSLQQIHTSVSFLYHLYIKKKLLFFFYLLTLYLITQHKEETFSLRTKYPTLSSVHSDTDLIEKNTAVISFDTTNFHIIKFKYKSLL